MDVNYISALAGLAGAAVGGMTSLGTTWITQRAQLRDKGFTAARQKREHLYNDFNVEASRLFADALGHERDEITDLVKLYSIMAHIRMISSAAVISSAERVIDIIIETYHGPNMTMADMRQFAASGGLDPLRDFGQACRLELLAYRPQHLNNNELARAQPKPAFASARGRTVRRPIPG